VAIKINSPVHFVVAMENISNPRCQLIHK